MDVYIYTSIDLLLSNKQKTSYSPFTMDTDAEGSKNWPLLYINLSSPLVPRFLFVVYINKTSVRQRSSKRPVKLSI